MLFYDKDTTYYYRAYVKVGDTYYYGKDAEGNSDVRRYGLELIDLGFGNIKWANINIGAQYDACAGDRYAWGETNVKSNYSQSTYLYYDSGYENLGEDISGSHYDVVKEYWGGNWRMPTRSEMQMLVDSCQWLWTSIDGQNGYLLTSLKNQNKIFLPAAGYQSTTYFNGVGEECHYWTSTLDTEAQSDILFATSNSRTINAANRFLGIPIRPVTKSGPDEGGNGNITGGHQQGGSQQTGGDNTGGGGAGSGNTGGIIIAD